jgi:hypothetical protein
MAQESGQYARAMLIPGRIKGLASWKQRWRKRNGGSRRNSGGKRLMH